MWCKRRPDRDQVFQEAQIVLAVVYRSYSLSHRNDVVEQQVPLVQGVVGPGELDRTAAVLSKKVLPGVR